MAGRPQKNNADYFTHDKDMRDDPKIKALRRKHGLDGYAIYVMLLEVLTDSDYFIHDFDDMAIELLSGDFGIDPNLLKEVLNYCDKLKLITIENEKIRNITLEKRFEPLLSKRKKDRSRIIASENTQSKVKYSIEENSIEENSIEENSIEESIENNHITKSKAVLQTEDLKKDAVSVSNSIDRFVKAFNGHFVYKGFNDTNVTAIKNSVLKYKKQIEDEYITVGIFLKVILKRLIDLDNDKEIKTPTRYFFSGAFGENKYLWRLTRQEEENGSGYHKPLMEKYMKENNPFHFYKSKYEEK